MTLLEQIRQKAASNKKTIVLPEGTEERTVKAVETIIKDQLANVILLGDPSEISAVAKKVGSNIDGATIMDPRKSELYNEYVEQFFEMRKSKGMTLDKAQALMSDPLYFGSMLVHNGVADGQVAGARNTTGDVLRPALQIIRTAPGMTSVSGAFIMIVPDCEFGDNGLFIFADCAVTPNPSAEQLAEFAFQSAQTAKTVAGIENPIIGMLSFSTKGSASHEFVDKVVKATEIAKQRWPELALDGEFQADAALVPKVGASKAPGSAAAGKANVLIFPDLDAGNIGYKLVQRLAKAEAIGPILQGMNKPVNDLSRGCSVEDVINVVAITAVKAQ
ncbi:MAG: phosphate acetyltransferase [Syntrophomonadaceae bacterium]|nr:phosphate acetyltransferase [Syntrophomonadaceae bacterium]